jgi:hypothetical protein
MTCVWQLALARRPLHLVSTVLGLLVFSATYIIRVSEV